MKNNAHCGYVAIIGRPNVGKSTLLNHLLGQKISITSRKPQTTRHRLLGIKTVENTQIIYVDTPGLHQQSHTALNRYLNRTAVSSLTEVDVIIWVVEARHWLPADAHIINFLKETQCPILLAVNKIDKYTDKTVLLAYLETVSEKLAFTEIFPISALKNDNLANLEQKVIDLLPENEFLFPEDYITDRSERFLAAEVIREKLVRRLGAELPYRLTVQIDYFKAEARLVHLSAVIWVERPGQKAIVIGKQGKLLKNVGTEARQELERLLDCKVMLQLWVKLKQGWSDDERALKYLGYSD